MHNAVIEQLSNKTEFRYWTSYINGCSACTGMQTKRLLVGLRSTVVAAAPESQPASQLRLGLSPLSGQGDNSKSAQHVSVRYPLVHPPPRCTSSSADVPDILDEPAYIPRMLTSRKDAAEEQARRVTRTSALLCLYSEMHVCVCVCVCARMKVLLSVPLYVAE